MSGYSAYKSRRRKREIRYIAHLKRRFKELKISKPHLSDKEVELIVLDEAREYIKVKAKKAKEAEDKHREKIRKSNRTKKIKTKSKIKPRSVRTISGGGCSPK